MLRIVVAAGLLLLCAASARAQFDSAQVSGVVQDSTGAVLPGVDITLVDTGTGAERRTVTNQSGVYTFPNVPVGTYKVDAALSGFRGTTKTGVQVNAGVNIRVDVQLEVGQLSETVRSRPSAGLAAGINYRQLFPGTKLDPEKLPNVALQGFTSINNNAYPGAWNDFVFQWADNVTNVRGNHTFKSGVSIERSGMNDQIQLTFAAAPATVNQNGAFRFFDTTRTDGTGFAAGNALLGLFDD